MSLFKKLFSPATDWVSTNVSAQQEIRSIVAADGKRYSQVTAAVKEVNFADGSIRYTPEPGSITQLVVSDPS
jgi:hypothetical protein